MSTVLAVADRGSKTAVPLACDGSAPEVSEVGLRFTQAIVSLVHS